MKRFLIYKEGIKPDLSLVNTPNDVTVVKIEQVYKLFSGFSCRL